MSDTQENTTFLFLPFIVLSFSSLLLLLPLHCAVFLLDTVVKVKAIFVNDTGIRFE